MLNTDLFNLCFRNPVGLAAGFDKNGIALESLAALGFGFIEAGTVTFHPQSGNPKPRMFRLAADQALINRAGFNNDGAAAFARRVEHHRPDDCVLGISIGKSKIAPLEDATADYLASFDLVYKLADYIAINVSSPNTPQLRELQQSDQLTSLLVALQTRNRELQQRYGRQAPVPLLVKISPDLARPELEMIVDVIQRLRIDGIIATNTTISRAGLATSPATVADIGAGGLSGRPLTQRSEDVVRMLRTRVGAGLVLVGVGGITTADDARRRLAAGADLLQGYTAFVYEGPLWPRRMVEGIVRGLATDD